MKIKNRRGWIIWLCPGCKKRHKLPSKQIDKNGWSITGGVLKPSLDKAFGFYMTSNPDSENPASISCQGAISGGDIVFTENCVHELANKIIPLEEIG